MTKDNYITPEGDFACAWCKRSHNSLRGLKIHEAKHRRDERKSHTLTPKEHLTFKCPWCNNSYDGGRKLSLHVTKSHHKTNIELFSALHPDARTTCIDCHVKVKLIDQEKGYPIRCSTCNRKHLYASTPHIAWNRGLTKHTDERVADAAKNMHEHYRLHGHHLLGKNKNNDQAVADKGKKTSASLKEHYATHNHWSKGLTSETSEIIARRGKSISRALTGKSFSDEHINALKRAKTLPTDVVMARLQSIGFELLSNYENSNKQHIILRCVECKQTCTKTLHAAMYGSRCPTCHPPWSNKTSLWQNEVYDFVNSLTGDAMLNDRSRLDGPELDIFVPTHRLAIECNGLYWHSEGAGRFDNDHVEKKRLMCDANAIRLLVLFQDEWEFKRDIVESMIRHRLNLSHKIHGRKLRIVRCSVQDLNDFFEVNHIDGYVNSNFGIMLIDETNIIGACTLRWGKHGSDKTTLEIARLCFKLNTHVNGGVSRLITAAKLLAKEQGCKCLTSYTDNRFGGTSYAKTGMTHNGTTVPRFWWTDYTLRYNRFKYKADKEHNLSEKQVTETKNVFKIYGCSNTRWISDL